MKTTDILMKMNNGHVRGSKARQHRTKETARNAFLLGKNSDNQIIHRYGNISEEFIFIFKTIGFLLRSSFTKD